MIDDIVRAYNRVTARTPYCYPISPEDFTQAVSAKKEFDPNGFFVGYRKGKPEGLIHTRIWKEKDKKRSGILLFLAEDRLLSRSLLDAAIGLMEREKATHCEVMGNVPGAQLFYGGVYMGYEVCLWCGFYEAISALKSRDFESTSHGFFMEKNLSAEPSIVEPAMDVSFRIEPEADTSPFYENSTIRAYAGEELIGYCGFIQLKRLSLHLGINIGQIHIWLATKHHRKHIGSALLSRAHLELFKAGTRKVILATNYSLYPAIKMYEKFGYRKELADVFGFARYFCEQSQK